LAKNPQGHQLRKNQQNSASINLDVKNLKIQQPENHRKDQKIGDFCNTATNMKTANFKINALNTTVEKMTLEKKGNKSAKNGKHYKMKCI
jgi:hypothetical protein